jgi:hypothetical protein
VLFTVPSDQRDPYPGSQTLWDIILILQEGSMPGSQTTHLHSFHSQQSSNML